MNAGSNYENYYNQVQHQVHQVPGERVLERRHCAARSESTDRRRSDDLAARAARSGARGRVRRVLH